MLLCFRKPFVYNIHWQSASLILIRVLSFRALWQIRLCSVALPIPLWKYGYSFAPIFLSASFARLPLRFLGVHFSECVLLHTPVFWSFCRSSLPPAVFHPHIPPTHVHIFDIYYIFLPNNWLACYIFLPNPRAKVLKKTDICKVYIRFY